MSPIKLNILTLHGDDHQILIKPKKIHMHSLFLVLYVGTYLCPAFEYIGNIPVPTGRGRRGADKSSLKTSSAKTRNPTLMLRENL